MPAISTDGVTLSFVHTGTGAPVFCLHSSGGSGGQWKRLGAELSPRYHVLAPDLHGHGGTSPWPYARPLRLSDEVALVEPLLTALPSPVHLIGHSYGGAVALKLALAAPARLRSLTLIEPVLFALLDPQNDPSDYLEVSQIAENTVRAVRAGQPAAAARLFVDYWSGAGAWAGLPDHARAVVERSIPAVARHWEAVLGDGMTLADLSAFPVPTLLLAGDHGPRPARRVTERLAATLPEAVLGMIAGAGHMSPLTHSAAVNAAIVKHLARHPADVIAAA
ncbi:MAG TPA: alpha/beta hydrolase [Methylomirabilota bacterium]|nr:alpha/beta hydrolase [Methylomirabilota bacterium]